MITTQEVVGSPGAREFMACSTSFEHTSCFVILASSGWYDYSGEVCHRKRSAAVQNRTQSPECCSHPDGPPKGHRGPSERATGFWGLFLRTKPAPEPEKWETV